MLWVRILAEGMSVRSRCIRILQLSQRGYSLERFSNSQKQRARSIEFYGREVLEYFVPELVYMRDIALKSNQHGIAIMV